MPPLPVRARTVRWLLLLALIAPLAVGVTGVGDREAGATSGSPAAVAVNFALRQLGKPYRWGGDGPRSYDFAAPSRVAEQDAAELRAVGLEPAPPWPPPTTPGWPP